VPVHAPATTIGKPGRGTERRHCSWVGPVMWPADSVPATARCSMNGADGGAGGGGGGAGAGAGGTPGGITSKHLGPRNPL
jgi:hypothetical protein